MHPNRIADLINILTPPDKPLDFEVSMLARNEGVLRIKFPSDFVEFGKAFGSGTIKSVYSWEVWSPFRPTYPLIVLEFARIWNIFKEAAETSSVPFGIFPEGGGVLPFAKTPDGDWVCWETNGDPDEWTVVDMGQYEPNGYQTLDTNFSGYFMSVLTRQLILNRHKNGDSWDPKKDLVFKQRVMADRNY